MLVIQVNIFMVLLLASIAVHAGFKLDRKEQDHRAFLRLLLLTIVILILEMISVLLSSSEYINFMFAQKLVNVAGFALAPFVPICAILYVYKITNKYQKIDRNKLLWLSVPLVINSIISLGSWSFFWIFGITNENSYVRGPLFLVSPLTSYFYYIVCLLVVYDNRKKLSKEEVFILSLPVGVPAVLSFFQLYFFVFLTIWNSVAVAVVINYIYLIYRQTKIDPLTGLSNRIAYDEYLKRLHRKNNIALAVITIDLDDFKSINDVFGHHEGDNVLKLFARMLEDAFAGKGVPIRWGGDEFIVLVNEHKSEIVEKYVTTLDEKIEAYNKNGYKPYQIKFSYGMTIFDSTYNNVYELVQQSDKLMYEKKQKKNVGEPQNLMQ